MKCETESESEVKVKDEFQGRAVELVDRIADDMERWHKEIPNEMTRQYLLGYRDGLVRADPS